MPIELTDIERLAQILERSGVDAIEVSELNRAHDIEPRTRPVVAEPHAGGAGKILARVDRVVDEQKLEQMLQLLTGEVGGHKRAARGRIDDPSAEGSHGKHIVDGLHARLSSREASTHQPIGGESDICARGLSEGVRDEIGEGCTRGDVGECVGDI